MNEGGSGEKESVAAGDAWLQRLLPLLAVCVCEDLYVRAVSPSESHSWPTTGMSARTV